MAITKNLVKVTVSTGYTSGATSIVLQAGHGAELPTTFPFYLTWWDSTLYADPADDPNVEIIAVTNVSTDTLTVTRGQQDTSATSKNTAASVYKMVLAPTAYDFGYITMVSSSSRTLYVDGVNGTDATAQRGNPFRPYKTATAAFAALQAGDVVLLYGSTYTVTPAYAAAAGGDGDVAPLKITGKNGVQVIGVGKPIIYGTGRGDFLTITSSDDILIDNIEFLGDDVHNDSWPVGKPIFFMIQCRDVSTYPKNVHVRNCVFRNYRDHGIGFYHASNSRVSGCYFTRGGWIKPTPNNGEIDGAAIAGCGRHTSIVNNTFYDCLRGVEMEGNMNYDAVVVSGNTFEKVWVESIMTFVTSHSAGDTKGYTIVGNAFENCHLSQAPYTITGLGQSCLLVTGGKQYMIADNNFYDVDRSMTLNAVDAYLEDINVCNNNAIYCLIRGIQIYDFTGDAYQARRINVTNNIIQNVSGIGLLVRSREIKIACNRIQDCQQGIKLEHATGILTTPNHVEISDNRIGNQEYSIMTEAIYIGSDYTDPLICDNNCRGATTPISNNAQGGGASVILRDNQT